jgi:hypothetical protein
MSADIADPDRAQYVAAVLEAYRTNRTTHGHVRAADRRLAAELFDSRISLQVVLAALALAALRRCLRPIDTAPLEPVRSLHYFKPVIDEILRFPEPIYINHILAKYNDLLPTR